MKRLSSKLTYSNVVATLALFLVVAGGSAFAATKLAKNSVGTKQLKNNAVTTAKIKNGAVTGSKIAPGAVTGADIVLNSLGTVPSATHAGTADKASSADIAASATKADTATTAATAGNSERLGGVSASTFVQKTAQPGEVLTGQISTRYPANTEFTIGAGSYRSPLPVGTPVPTLVYTTSTTAQCPGVGQASSGVLCVYGYNVSNINTVTTSGGFTSPNYRFGFSVDISPTTASSPAFFLASWAYQVP